MPLQPPTLLALSPGTMHPFALASVGRYSKPKAPRPDAEAELHDFVQAPIEEQTAKIETEQEKGDQIGSLGLVYETDGLWDSAAACSVKASLLSPQQPLWKRHRVIYLNELGEANAAPKQFTR